MHASRRALLIVCLAGTILIGCSPNSTRVSAPTGAWSPPTGAWSPEPDYVATVQNDAAVAAARRYLIPLGPEHSTEFDYCYTVNSDDKGNYRVLATRIYGYDGGGNPDTVPGGHTTIVVSPQFEVVRMIGGK